MALNRTKIWWEFGRNTDRIHHVAEKIINAQTRRP